MAEILTQEEIDALLSTVSTEEIAKPAKSSVFSSTHTAHKRISAYDFKRPNRVSKDQMRAIKNLHDKLARNFSSSLSAYLRVIVDVSLISVDQMTYGEFLMSLPDPTCFNIISMYPLEGNSVLELNPSLVFPIIDKLLGGTGQGISKVRQLTDIEQNIIEGILLLLLEDMREMWRPIIDMHLKIEAKETSPHVLQIVSTNEVVILVCFEIKMGEVSGIMNICLPAVVLEPILPKIDAQDWFLGAKKTIHYDNEVKLKRLLSKSVINLIAELGTSKLKIRDLLKLKVGDIVVLNSKVESDLIIRVSNQPKLKGRLGAIDNKKAMLITDRIVDEDDELEKKEN
ncbi:MAG: flagellar motor switch protein FliM [bacterium]